MMNSPHVVKETSAAPPGFTPMASDSATECASRTGSKRGEGPSRLGSDYFMPEALALSRNVSSASDLSDHEAMMLALTAAQAAFAKYTFTGDAQACRLLNDIMLIFKNHHAVHAALMRIQEMLRGGEEQRSP
jgi:hypothetical protein